ncbi:MAG: N-acetyl sugar amidotransferase [Planctomycetes bacterium]|nr:N-acetyl sugar amidotransferase [Planctomycetota bacterium]
MNYCKRCLYPENAKPTIIFDEQGVCSGCRYHESRQTIDWSEREKLLREILAEYKQKAKEAGNPYDCIIPVSGGKDSHYQVYLMKVVYGMNPLLVTYNHTFNTKLGLRNLNNIVEKFGVDLIRFTANTESVRKISRYMVKTVGDITWHYHAGIRTFPFQVSVKWNIPLVIWGEHGFAEIVGLVSLEDMVEFTKWTRQEHDMRGYEPEDLINEESGITSLDVAPYVFPTEEQISETGMRGIYLSNFMYWDALEQAKEMVHRYDFGLREVPNERSFVLHAKSDDHANDVHDYLKYLKFGYGRATDDATTEIRHGRMTREEGTQLVSEYDSVRPSTLQSYLDFMGITEQTFLDWVEPMRDLNIWEKHKSTEMWVVKDSIVLDDREVDDARLLLVRPEDRTFGSNNKRFFCRDKSKHIEYSPITL